MVLHVTYIKPLFYVQRSLYKAHLLHSCSLLPLLLTSMCLIQSASFFVRKYRFVFGINDDNRWSLKSHAVQAKVESFQFSMKSGSFITLGPL